MSDLNARKDEIQYIYNLKNMIVSNGRAIFGSAYGATHTYDVIVTRKKELEETQKPPFIAELVSHPSYRNYIVIAKSKYHPTMYEAAEELWDRVRTIQ